MIIIIVPNEPNPNMTGRHYGIAKSLAAAGHEVHTVMWDLPQLQTGSQRFSHLFRSLQSRDYAYEDLNLHKIRRLPYFWPVINGWLFGRELKRLFKRTDADIIFAMSYTNETTIPKGLPLIYDLADDYYAPAIVFNSLAYRLMFAALGVRRAMQKNCQRALAVTAVSDVLCDYARPFNQNVIKLPNGVETDLIRRSRKRSAGAVVNPHSLIYVTGFGPWSRPLDLMREVTKLRKNFPNIELSLVGEGSEVTNIENYIAKHDAGNYIHYRGFIHDRASVFDMIASHAIGVNISYKNIWRDAAHPMKVIEYSALGKTVVSTDLEGVKALAYSNVKLFSDTNPKLSLHKALQAALGQPIDPKTANLVSDTVLLDYDWTKLAQKLVETVALVLNKRRMPRITHVTPAYPPNLGGLEKVVEELARAEHNLGNSVQVITSNQGAIKAAMTEQVPEVFPISRLSSFVFANTTIILSLFWRLLKLSKSEVVHLHVTQAYTPEMVWLASRLKGFRYVAHIHLDVAASGWAGLFLKPYKATLLKQVLQNAQAVIVFTCDQQTATINQYGLDPKKVVVIPNGVEAVFYDKKPRAAHDPTRLLFVGRLSRQKNLDQLLQALDGISEDFQTTLVGEGELRNELITSAKDLHIKHVRFAGRVNGDKRLAFYRAADIFVLPSEREGMPLVLLEAMAMGLPVIVTNVTGNRDIIKSKKNGLLVPYNDAPALQKALLSLAGDKATYKGMHRASLEMAKAYTWPKIAERFIKLYKETG